MNPGQIVSAVVTEDPRPLLTQLLRLLADTRDYAMKIATRHNDPMDDAEAVTLSLRAGDIAERVKLFSASMRDGAVS